MTPLDFRLQDVVTLRKPHPSGGNAWTVVRLGADIGLRCDRCGHRLLLPRPQVERRFQQFLRRGSVLPEGRG